MRTRLKTGIKQATVNGSWLPVSFVSAVGQMGMVEARSGAEIEKGAEARKRITVLSDAEIAKLMAAAVADQDPLIWLSSRVG